MSWTDVEERVAAKSKFDASVRLLQRSASSKPALIVALRKTITADLKWKAADTFGLAFGSGDVSGKFRIIRRKDKVIAKPRLMKTDALSFDFGHIASLGERGTLKAEAVAVIINADTVEVTIPAFEYEDEVVAEADDEEEEQQEQPSARAAAPATAQQLPKPVVHRANAVSARTTQPITVSGVTIRFEPENECVAFRGKSMEVTTKQAHFVAALAKAMPQPVGREFLMHKVWPERAPATASMVLDQIAMDLTKALPGIKLQLKNVKGVGFALSEAA